MKLSDLGTREIMARAYDASIVIPAFNIPYLPMMKPVVQAVIDEDSFAFVAVARLEWIKFESKSVDAIREEYEKQKNPQHTRLHLDHVPVIDEDNLRVDYLPIISHALDIGYDSVMIDGSRLSFEDNAAATREVSDLAHSFGRPIEGELGAVFGHEEAPPLSYDEIFRSRSGFTDPVAAREFVAQSACDWLSVAVGSIHGAVSVALRNTKKVNARLDLDHLRRIADETGVPLVLHGGSGVEVRYVQASIQLGISKINIGTEIRQAYEQALRAGCDVEQARTAVYDRTRWVIRDMLGADGTRARLEANER